MYWSVFIELYMTPNKQEIIFNEISLILLKYIYNIFFMNEVYYLKLWNFLKRVLLKASR
jgi:hypothetical protein